MIRLVIKLLLVALVLNATYRVGSAYWDHYQFEDAVQQAAQFSERAPAEAIKQQVVHLAAERELPLGPDDIQVAKTQRRTTVEGTYARDIEVVPRYIRRWVFNVHVTVFSVN
jgi:hypothetical protein